MKRYLAALIAVLCLVGFSFCVTAEETEEVEETDLNSRIQNALEIRWASKDYIELNGNMIRVSDGKTLMVCDWEYYDDISSTGGYVWFPTHDGIRIMDQTGSIRSLEANLDGWRLRNVFGKYGLFFGRAEKTLVDDGNQTIIDGWTEKWKNDGKTFYRYSDSDMNFVYNPDTDQFTMMPGVGIGDVYQDPEGQIYILTNDWSTFGIYKANGEQVVEEGKYGSALNHNGELITNEYLTIYTDNGIGAISPFTGEVIWTLDDCHWPLWDASCLIYSDNISIVESEEGRMLVGLDGTILCRLYCNDIPYRVSVYGGFGENYNVLTDRTYDYEKESDGIQYITCEETGEIFKEIEDGNAEEKKFRSLKSGKIFSEDEILASGEIIPERYEKYKPVEDREYCIRDIYPVENGEETHKIEITSPDGKVLGGQAWERIADEWYKWRGDIGDYAFFRDTSLCAVVDENELCAVINTDGEIVLPAEYEQVVQISSFSDDPKANGHCLIAMKDEQRYIFSEKGELLYPDT